MATKPNSWQSINIHAEYDQLVGTRPRDPAEYVLSEAQRDLGGNFSLHTNDELHVYLPTADILFQDSGKVDLSRGLGGLGLIAVQESDAKKMSEKHVIEYAAAILNFSETIRSQSAKLKVADQFEFDTNLGRRYPGGKSDEWAHTYGEELRAFRQALVTSALYGFMDSIKDACPREIGTEQFFQTQSGKQNYKVHVEKNSDGAIRVRHDSKTQQRVRVA